MPKKGYDISKIEDCITSIKIQAEDKGSVDVLRLTRLQKELNEFFTESTCYEVLFTKNTDKLFFGICCYPSLTPVVTDIMVSDKKVNIERYAIEFDSKLFNLGMSTKEITATLLHEIGHIVCDVSGLSIYHLRKNIDLYLLKNDDNLELKSIDDTKSILSLGMVDMLIKANSIFNKDDEEFVADEFVIACGYGSHLESALKKITRSAWGLNKTAQVNKISIFTWCIRLYRNVGIKRISAIHTLNKAKTTTGSTLLKRDMDNVIRAMNTYTPSEKMSEVVESAVLEKAFGKNNSLFASMKYNGLRALEDDLYEYNVRVKNAETEEDVMYALRGINTRMSLLDDYIMKERDNLSDAEIERWSSLYREYSELRKYLAKKKSYNFKNYGLFYDYNQFDRLNRNEPPAPEID